MGVTMGIEQLRDFVGEWELEVGLPGAGGLRGRVVFEALGDVLVRRTYMPVPEAPDSVCAVVATEAGFVLPAVRQHVWR
jgi:hypothetical protein